MDFPWSATSFGNWASNQIGKFKIRIQPEAGVPNSIFAGQSGSSAAAPFIESNISEYGMESGWNAGSAIPVCFQTPLKPYPAYELNFDTSAGNQPSSGIPSITETNYEFLLFGQNAEINNLDNNQLKSSLNNLLKAFNGKNE